MVSASYDHMLEVWDLATCTCRLTHRGDTGCLSLAVSMNTAIAGDGAGGVWFLDWPRSDQSQPSAHGATRPTSSTPPPTIRPLHRGCP